MSYFKLIILLLFIFTGIQGQILFTESFEDDLLEKRGWYDGTACRITGNEAFGKGCIEYEWIKGIQPVQGSSSLRHLFNPAEEVYVRYNLKLSKNWKWTGVNWHPHLTHFMTTENSEYHGPAASHLTLYVEPVNGKLRLAATDIQNEKMPHGLTQGPLKGGYNGLLYDSREILFTDDKWHCIEACFKLNTLNMQHGSPNSDGIVRAWFDGKLVIEHTDVVLRSADFPEMKLNQFLIAPYFGPGLLDNDQKLWIDDLVVSTGHIGKAVSDKRISANGIRLYTDSAWISDDSEKRFTYGLGIDSPCENAVTLFMHFPEHLEFNPVGNTILRHYDSIPVPWIISPDGRQASYRVESPALKNVTIESFVRQISEDDLPSGVNGVKLAMHIINNGQEVLPVIRPLICVQYSGLTGFPARMDHNFEHNYIVINGEMKALSDFVTADPGTTFKGCVVRNSPQRDTRSEATGGLITQDMDLALSVVTSMDNNRSIIIWWTPGKSMIANACIPCMHADPYFGTLRPGEEAFAEGFILFTGDDPEPIIKYLIERDRKVF